MAANPVTYRFFRDFIRSNFGIGVGGLVGLGALLYLSLGWFEAALQEFLSKQLDDRLGTRLSELTGIVIEGHWVLGLIFPALLVFFLLRFRRFRESAIIRLVADEHPAGAKALILYLSPFGQKRSDGQPADPAEIQGDIADLPARKKLTGPWRMPIEAIWYHLDHKSLEKVVIIPSADDDRGMKGTFRDFEHFRALVRRITARAAPHLDVRAVHELLDDDEFRNGIDFENGEALLTATSKVWSALEASGYKARDILIDITGGQKVTGIAGAGVALHDGRVFEYVSTRDYGVRTFDFIYERAPD